jgi:hypothetical protein
MLLLQSLMTKNNFWTSENKLFPLTDPHVLHKENTPEKGTQIGDPSEKPEASK